MLAIPGNREPACRVEVALLLVETRSRISLIRASADRTDILVPSGSRTAAVTTEDSHSWPNRGLGEIDRSDLTLL